ncbi:hypothetical protein TCON_2232 [Astathelohania contejeani]|uniref:Gustatory receptor n=1 Tax=Astathelohania contejeani TaxID=164912 RepID=A0ABQ7HWL3_9MICR|nr:hypothetical protein TCON_2232 [Thelohania contejeani]
MDININFRIFIIALLFCLTQIAILIGKLVLGPRKKLLSFRKTSFGRKRALILSIFSANMSLFIIYNILGALRAYSQGNVAYRSAHVEIFDQILQILEITFESIQKSLLFFSLVLFLPVFTSINIHYDSFSVNKTYIITISAYSFIRVLLYPILYFIFFNYSLLGLFLIELLSISETFLLMFIYLSIYGNLHQILCDIKIYNYRKASALKFIFSKFNTIARVFLFQFGLEIIYRSFIIAMYFMKYSYFNHLLLDGIMFLRVVSFSLQFYCLTRLVLNDNEDPPDAKPWTPQNYTDGETMVGDPYIKIDVSDMKLSNPLPTTGSFDTGLFQPNTFDMLENTAFNQNYDPSLNNKSYPFSVPEYIDSNIHNEKLNIEEGEYDYEYGEEDFNIYAYFDKPTKKDRLSK